MIAINKNPTRRELRQFGFIWLGFFALAGAVIWYRSGDPETSLWVWTIAATVAAAGFIWPSVMRLVYLGMSYLAFPIGWTVSHVVLAVVFYLIITPLGLALRLLKKDAMQREFERSRRSYWEEIPEVEDSSRYFKQF